MPSIRRWKLPIASRCGPASPGQGPELREPGGHRHEQVHHRVGVDAPGQIPVGVVGHHLLEEPVDGQRVGPERGPELGVTLDLDGGHGGEGGQSPVGGVHVDREIEDGLDLLGDPGAVGEGGIELAEDRLLHLAVDLDEQVGLGREVAVDGAGGESGRGADVLVGGDVVAVGPEAGPGGGQNPGPGVGLVDGRWTGHQSTALRLPPWSVRVAR